MDDKSDIVNEKPPPVTVNRPEAEKKSNIFVESSAVIPESPAETSVIPVYAILQSQQKQVLEAWGWLAATALFCAWTTSFTYAVFISEKPLPRAYGWSPSLTQQLVNIASHVAVIFTTGLVSAVFDALSWSLASRPEKDASGSPRGTTLGTFLAVGKNTSLVDVVRLFLIPGSQVKWCILRFFVAGAAWVVGVVLLSHVTVQRVYISGPTFGVTAGLSDMHTSILALERLNVIPNSTSDTFNSATVQDTGINMMITGSTNSIMVDPTFVKTVAPISCKSSDCKSLFLPGGMQLVRYSNNGSAVNTTLAPKDSVIIVNNAPGFHVEYEPSNYSFNYATDCTMYGYDVSSFFSCLKYINGSIISGVTVCPPTQMFAGTCKSDQNYTNNLDAKISISLYQRNATVSYDKTNFSIIDVRHISAIDSAANIASQDIVADFQKIFTVMYPPLSNILTDLVGLIGDFDKIWPDLAYWSSVYCVQSEIAATQWLYDRGFPTWTEGKQELLEGLMTIPIQFGTMMWQFVDVKGLPQELFTSASFSSVEYRTRSPIWPIALFAAMSLGLVLWAMIILIYIYFSGYEKAQEDDSATMKAAFGKGNPYDVDDSGFLGTFWDFICSIFGKPRHTRASSKVVARSLVHNKFLIAVEEKRESI